MKKNPYTIIRTVLGWAAASLLGLLFLGLVIMLLVSVRVASGSWGQFFLNILIFLVFVGALFGILAGITYLGGKTSEWWRKREADYKTKVLRDAAEAGNPFLDPEPINWYGFRSAYYPLGEYSSATFAPREHYEQGEARYIEKYDAMISERDAAQ